MRDPQAPQGSRVRKSMRCARLSSWAGFDFHFQLQLQSESYFYLSSRDCYSIILFFSFVVSVFILYNFHLPFIYRTFRVESSRDESKRRGRRIPWQVFADNKEHAQMPKRSCRVQGRSITRRLMQKPHSRQAEKKRAKTGDKDSTDSVRKLHPETSRNRISELSRCRSSCTVCTLVARRCGEVRCSVCSVCSALDAPTHAHLRAQPGLRG